MPQRLTAETTVLAATRAALDQERAAWQNDILISTIIEVLDRKGPLTQRELRDQLSLTWVARQTNPALITSALETAHDQGLIDIVQARRGRRAWQVSDAIRLEAKADREWARILLADFQEDIRIRLEKTFPDDSEIGARAPRLMKLLISAMVTATRSVFEAIQNSRSPSDLHEVRFSLRTAMPELQDIKPVELAETMADLILSAADPDENFGDEILRAIVAGQILHGMVCRGDVSARPPQTKLVLDTSQLLNLASHEPRVVDLFHDFLETARSHGCELVLTDRVQDEWDHHWQVAATEERRLRERLGGSMPDLLLISNIAALAAYGHAVKEKPDLTFAGWASSRRSLRPIINRYGINVVDTNGLEIETHFVASFARAIAVSISESGRPYPRSEARRETDGYSAALVSAHRKGNELSVGPSAWFVAADRHSDAAYGSMTGDDFPLCVTARSWILYYSAFDTAGHSRAELAERVTEDIILESFLSIASSYTADEMLELGDLLSKDDQLDKESVREIMRETFLHPEQLAASRVRDFARSRIQRQNQRALRAHELDVRHAREQQRLIDAKDREIEKLQHERKAAREAESLKAHKARRLAEAAIVLAVLVVGLTLATTLGWWPNRKIVLVGWVIVAGILPFEAYKYVTSIRSRRSLVIEIVSAGGLLATALLLEHLLL